VNISSGGLAILAIAAIWFLVFLPSFVKGDQSKRVEPETPQESIVPKLSDGAKQALRARRARTIAATFASVSFLLSGLAVVEVVVAANGLPLAVGSVIATVISAWVAVRAHRKYIALLSGSPRRVVPVNAPTKRSIPEVNETELKTWQPGELPKQSYLQTGAIEIVELAEVVSIDSEKSVNEIANIDEILRRRRHVG
jgi:hypothetical protein